MNEAEEAAWEQGNRAAYRDMLGQCLRHLGEEGDADRWRLERLDTVAKLRELCAAVGDNDWPDGLHLADVIEKHLANHLVEE